MEIRRSNYTPLARAPDDELPSQAQPLHHEPQSVDAHTGRLGNAAAVGLQRQSSESSYRESSLSGDVHAPTVSTLSGIELDAPRLSHEDVCSKAVDRCSGGSSSGKSWAQQTEESYQLQLALALRLSSDATSAQDPYFLDPVLDASSPGASSWSSSESVSHRFWVTYSSSTLV